MRFPPHAAVRLIACSVVSFLLIGCGPSPAERLEWPTMGTVAAVQYNDNRDVPLWDAAPSCTKFAFAEVEKRLNAHDPKSEIVRLAALPEKDVLARCDAQMRPCYAAAFRLMEVSGGAFNPRWKGPGSLDLGAIAKGFAVDLADASFADLKRKTGWRLLIDLGGNVKSAKGDWKTGVKDPNGNGLAATVTLKEGEALATSATYYRGEHIYDGRTHAPVTNGVASVTVLCKSAMWADGLSTTLFVLGPDEGRAFLDKWGQTLADGERISVLWILQNGTRVTYGDARF